MLQKLLFAIRDISIEKTFGMSAMFHCDADKYALSDDGVDYDITVKNRPFRQSLYISIRS